MLVESKLFNFKAWWASIQRAQWKKRLRDKRYEFLLNDSIKGEYVCFDCETTGLNPSKDRIISLSAIKIQGNQILTSQSLNLLIRQQKEISEKSIVIHQIRNTDINKFSDVLMDEREAIDQFLRFIKGATLVGYYLEFDIAMVNHIIKPWLGVSLPNNQVEVSEQYYHSVIKKQRIASLNHHVDLRFDTILSELNIPDMGQHDAFGDALMTALVFVKLQARSGK